jgi:ribosomal protein S27AE
MKQSRIYDPPGPIDQPPCPKCGERMWLARIEPTDKPDYDQRTFECPRCEQSETMMVKYK